MYTYATYATWMSHATSAAVAAHHLLSSWLATYNLLSDDDIAVLHDA
jgi:hypothetical protein